MFKPVTDLTERDKLWFFEMYKRNVTHYDLDEWPKMEVEIQARIDEIFDDKAFSKLSAKMLLISDFLGALFEAINAF